MIFREMEEQCGFEWLIKISKIKGWSEAFDTIESSRKNIVMNLPHVTLIEEAVWPLSRGKIHAILPQKMTHMEGLQQSIKKVEGSLKIKIQLNPFHGTAILRIKFHSLKQDFKVDTCMAALLIYL